MGTQPEELFTLDNVCDISTRFISLPPAMKLRQGNVFTPVCDSVNRGVSVLGGLCPAGLFQGDKPPPPATIRLRAGGTHPT